MNYLNDFKRMAVGREMPGLSEKLFEEADLRVLARLPEDALLDLVVAEGIACEATEDEVVLVSEMVLAQRELVELDPVGAGLSLAGKAAYDLAKPLVKKAFKKAKSAFQKSKLGKKFGKTKLGKKLGFAAKRKKLAPKPKPSTRAGAKPAPKAAPKGGKLKAGEKMVFGRKVKVKPGAKPMPGKKPAPRPGKKRNESMTGAQMRAILLNDLD